MIANCLGCKDAVEYETSPPLGWVVETRPTLGGGAIEYQMCFPCRGLTLTPNRMPRQGWVPSLVPLDKVAQ